MPYRHVAATLRHAIEDGTYPPGSTLPRQVDIAEEFGVNVKTVRAAVALLAAEGLVTPVRKRGTVVREAPEVVELGSDHYAGPGERVTETLCARMPTPDEIDELGLLPGEPVVEVGTVARTRGRVVRRRTEVYPAHQHVWSYTWDK